MEQEVFLKIHQGYGKEAVIAVCDAEIIGETFSNGTNRARIHVSRSFYEGELVSLSEAIEVIQNATNVNLVGRKIVEKTVEEGLASPEAVITIGEKDRKVPHLILFRL